MPPPPRRPSRLGLYLPIGLLCLVAVGWSVAWWVITGKTERALDGWLASEQAAGRRWTCLDRTIGGYPFRIEIGCASFGLERPDVKASFGRLGVVAQIYRPQHVIAEASGPLSLTAAGTQVDATWSKLRASVISSARGLESAALLASEPTIAITPADSLPTRLAARELESHVRPRPDRPDAWDVSLETRAAIIPGLDDLVGGRDPADLFALVGVTQAKVLPARPLAQEFARWREAGGEILLDRLALAKGPTRFEANGTLALDAMNRPTGRIDSSASGLGGLVGPLLNSPAGNLVGALLGGGRARPAAQPQAGAPPLKPLPPIVLQDGRVLLGPLPVPGLRLPRLGEGLRPAGG